MIHNLKVVHKLRGVKKMYWMTTSVTSVVGVGHNTPVGFGGDGRHCTQSASLEADR